MEFLRQWRALGMILGSKTDSTRKPSPVIFGRSIWKERKMPVIPRVAKQPMPCVRRPLSESLQMQKKNTPYRGLTAATAWVKLKFAAMNLEKLTLHKWRPFLLFFLHLLQEAALLTLQSGFFDSLRAESRCFQSGFLFCQQVQLLTVSAFALQIHV